MGYLIYITNWIAGGGNIPRPFLSVVLVQTQQEYDNLKNEDQYQDVGDIINPVYRSNARYKIAQLVVQKNGNHVTVGNATDLTNALC